MEKKRSYAPTLLLSFFLGGLGIHRFYTGYIGIGIAQLLTLGGCGIWYIVDLVNICFNNFKDADGNELDEPNLTLGKIFFFVWLALFILSWFTNGLSFIEAIKG